MGNMYAISALRRKRAHLAGEVEKAERAIAAQRQTLATLDAVILLFEPHANPELIPSIRPTRFGLFFRHGEQRRLCLDALRESGRPMTAPQITAHVMLAKGLPADDPDVRRAIGTQTRMALRRLLTRGIVRKVIEAPDTWWELVGGTGV